MTTAANIAERLSLVALDADFLPECIAMHDNVEIPARYQVTRDDLYLRAVKINGYWCDPVKWFPLAVIRLLESDCAAHEHDMAELSSEGADA